jgi:hypothetical protein
MAVVNNVGVTVVHRPLNWLQATRGPRCGTHRRLLLQ